MTGGKFTRRVTAEENDVPTEGTLAGAPLGGTRTEAGQRLQIGLGGLAAMVLLVGLASALGNQADQTEEDAVPEAAPTTEPTEQVEAPQRDPLADAGIVPDIQLEPSPAPTDAPTAGADAAQTGQTLQDSDEPANGAPQD